MKAEEIYSIAIHLSETELKKLHMQLGKIVNEKTNTYKKKFRKILITKDEARRHILKTVFKIYI